MELPLFDLLGADVAPSPLPPTDKSVLRAAARLREWAARQEVKAVTARDQPRLANTRRRAQQADAAVRQAVRDLATARTVRRVGEALERGELRLLMRIRNATQAQELLRLAHRAHARAVNAESPYVYVDPDQRRPLRPEDMQHAEYPWPYVRLWGKEEEAWREALPRALFLYNTSPADAHGLVQHRQGEKWLVAQTAAQVRLLQQVAAVADKDLAERLADSLKSARLLLELGIEDQAQLVAALTALAPCIEGVERPDPVAEAERSLVGTKIPGFFPTPRPVVQKMLRYLRLNGQPLRVLEPSAGTGNIADVVREVAPTATVECCEVSSTLRHILTLKGHTIVADDCYDLQPGTHAYDAVVMNPPFEKGEDMRQVRHAYALLQPGGTLVSIVSSATQHRSDKTTQAFRQWLDEVGGYFAEELPSGTFADPQAPRSTNVTSTIIVIEKA